MSRYEEEGHRFHPKSLRTVSGKTADWPELAKDCVAFANAAGGELHIGVENDDDVMCPVPPTISRPISRTP